MDQIIHILAGWFWSILVMLSPIIFIDLVFFNGRFTRRLFGMFGNLIEGTIMLIFRGIGSAIRGLSHGIWRGIRGNQQGRQRGQRIEHHHFIHREDE